MREMTIMGEYLDIKSSAVQVKSEWAGSISIIASSFGAGSAIFYSSLFPKIVNSLILLNPVLDYNATFLNPLEEWGKGSFNDEGYNHLEEKGYLLLDGIHELDAKLIAEFSCIKPYEILSRLDCPVLTIHGDEDSMVPFQISKKYGSPNKKSKFVAISRADHGFIDYDDEEGTTSKSLENQSLVIQHIIKWIKKWGKQ
jgi:pimeloyl-ACP methyl ester carboxylesterase